MTVRILTCVDAECDDCGATISEYGFHYENLTVAFEAARDAEWYVSRDMTRWICWECLEKPEHGHLRALRDAETGW